MPAVGALALVPGARMARYGAVLRVAACVIDEHGCVHEIDKFIQPSGRHNIQPDAIVNSGLDYAALGDAEEEAAVCAEIADWCSDRQIRTAVVLAREHHGWFDELNLRSCQGQQQLPQLVDVHSVEMSLALLGEFIPTFTLEGGTPLDAPFVARRLAGWLSQIIVRYAVSGKETHAITSI